MADVRETMLPPVRVLEDHEEIPQEAASRHGYGLPIYFMPDVEIYLDGVLQRDVIAYSLLQGWLDRNKLDGDGRPVVDPDAREIEVERCKGVITFARGGEWRAN